MAEVIKCPCEAEDGLVKEWVSKVKSIAQLKGYSFVDKSDWRSLFRGGGCE